MRNIVAERENKALAFPLHNHTSNDTCQYDDHSYLMHHDDDHSNLMHHDGGDENECTGVKVHSFRSYQSTDTALSHTPVLLDTNNTCDDNTPTTSKSRETIHLSPTTARAQMYIIVPTLFIGFCLGFSVATWFVSSQQHLQQRNDGTSRLQAILHSEQPWQHDFPTERLSEVNSKQRIAEKTFLELKSDGGSNLLDDIGDLPVLSSSQPSEPTAARPNVYMNHIEAYERLLDNDKKSGGLLGSPASLGPFATHYFLLNSGLDVQVNQAYCPAATVAAILNSLRFMHPRSEIGVDIPTDSMYSPYSYATQMDLFGPCTTKNVIGKAGPSAFDGWGSDGILSFPYGLNLEQTAGLLRCHLNATAGWTVTATHLDETHLTLSKMRYDMKVALADPSSRLLVNYHRATAGQVGSGHFSPVGAFHPGSDSFLILDVARYKYPPVWIDAEILYKSMKTIDECGDWNYPNAQSQLDDKLLVAKSADDQKEARAILGCQRAPRGYVIAKRS